VSFADYLNSTVEFYSRSFVGGGSRPVETWALESTVNGMSELTSGGETVKDNNIVVLYTHMLYVEHMAVNAEWRVRIDGADVYNIVSIHNPVNKDRHLEIKLLLLPPGTAAEMGI